MGCAPGITNVLARFAVEKLGGATSVKIRVGTRDFHPPAAEFCFPYSAQTIVEEFTLTPWIFSGGKFREVAPRTAWERVIFPQPVGAQWLVRTRHSEVATLPGSLGLRFCDFKVGFDRAFVREVMRRLRAGWTVRDFAKLPMPRRAPDDYEIARVVVDGKLAVDCHAQAKPAWEACAGDVDTGCPASIVAQMVATGVVADTGVLPPELVVPVKPFFAELRTRGMKIVEVWL
jgi:saccharopine dehydrogenase-like NADP-dependent oxidoreductase